MSLFERKLEWSTIACVSLEFERDITVLAIEDDTFVNRGGASSFSAIEPRSLLNTRCLARADRPLEIERTDHSRRRRESGLIPVLRLYLCKERR